MGAARLLVPRNPFHRRRGGDADLRALPLRLPPGARGVHAAIGDRLYCGTHPWRRAVGSVLQGLGAGGAPGHRGRSASGADGDARGLRHGVLFRRSDLRDRHLPELVFLLRPGCGGAACAVSSGRCAGPRHAGTTPKAASAAPRRRAAVRGDAACGADRRASRKRCRGLHAAGLLRFSPANDPSCDHGVGIRARSC
jgi:hypothetical protein